MNADEIRKLRKQANPIAQLMEAMEGTWRERNEPVVTAVRGAGVVIGIDVNQDAGAVFYGKELLERVEVLCRVCGGAAEMVHHVVSIAQAPHRRLDPTNVASLCNGCHAKVHARTVTVPETPFHLVRK